MKKAAIVVGLFGSLAQLAIVSDNSIFEPSSPPPAAIVLAITGIAGAVVTFKQLRIGGIIMLLSGLLSSWIMVTTLQGLVAISEAGGHSAPPGLFGVTLILSISGNIILIIAGILALIPRKAKPEATRNSN